MSDLCGDVRCVSLIKQRIYTTGNVSFGVTLPAGRVEGWDAVAATHLALNDVLQDEGVLSSTHLSAWIADTNATDYGALMATRAACAVSVPIIIGPENSARGAITGIVAEQEFAVPLLAPTATADRYSDKNEYPLFSRLAPADKEQAKALADVFDLFGWRGVVVVATDEPYGLGLLEDLRRDLDGHKIEIHETILVNDLLGTDPEYDSNYFAESEMTAIREADTNIIVLLAGGSTQAAAVIRELALNGMLGKEANGWTSEYQLVGTDGWVNAGIADVLSFGSTDRRVLSGVVGLNLYIDYASPEFERFISLWRSVPGLENATSCVADFLDETDDRPPNVNGFMYGEWTDVDLCGFPGFKFPKQLNYSADPRFMQRAIYYFDTVRFAAKGLHNFLRINKTQCSNTLEDWLFECPQCQQSFDRWTDKLPHFHSNESAVATCEQLIEYYGSCAEWYSAAWETPTWACEADCYGCHDFYQPYELQAVLRNTTMRGATGTVELDPETGDRRNAVFSIMNLQSEGPATRAVPVGVWNSSPAAFSPCTLTENVIWRDGATTQVGNYDFPSDGIAIPLSWTQRPATIVAFSLAATALCLLVLTLFKATKRMNKLEHELRGSNRGGGGGDNVIDDAADGSRRRASAILKAQLRQQIIRLAFVMGLENGDVVVKCIALASMFFTSENRPNWFLALYSVSVVLILCAVGFVANPRRLRDMREMRLEHLHGVKKAHACLKKECSQSHDHHATLSKQQLNWRRAISAVKLIQDDDPDATLLKTNRMINDIRITLKLALAQDLPGLVLNLSLCHGGWDSTWVAQVSAYFGLFALGYKISLTLELSKLQKTRRRLTEEITVRRILSRLSMMSTTSSQLKVNQLIAPSPSHESQRAGRLALGGKKIGVAP